MTILDGYISIECGLNINWNSGVWDCCGIEPVDAMIIIDNHKKGTLKMWNILEEFNIYKEEFDEDGDRADSTPPDHCTLTVKCDQEYEEYKLW